ncbi:MAG TPA: winged helix-turn-helix domain-containing protein [Actinomycetes bacterium]|jgi:DNA-binding MarR family transcriptional regulator|nr:winged helix-turn-helix domain-containing protein [Actinomycetes bacterium]
MNHQTDGPRTGVSPGGRTLDVADPIRLRALAHPLRLRLLRLLREHQPATGAQLAELTGESTASISYHLATLAKHGFVEHDPGPAPTRRHKPWRTTYQSLRIVSEHTEGPPIESPEGVILTSMLDESRRQQDDYVHGRSDLPPQLRDVGTFEMTDLTLTVEELEELSEAVQQAIGRFRKTGSSADRARFAVSFVAIPVAVPTDARPNDEEAPR